MKKDLLRWSEQWFVFLFIYWYFENARFVYIDSTERKKSIFILLHDTSCDNATLTDHYSVTTHVWLEREEKEQFAYTQTIDQCQRTTQLFHHRKKLVSVTVRFVFLKVIFYIKSNIYISNFWKIGNADIWLVLVHLKIFF